MAGLTKLQKYQTQEMVDKVAPAVSVAVVSEIKKHHYTKNQILGWGFGIVCTGSGLIILALVKFPKIRELFTVLEVLHGIYYG